MNPKKKGHKLYSRVIAFAIVCIALLPFYIYENVGMDRKLRHDKFSSSSKTATVENRENSSVRYEERSPVPFLPSNIIRRSPLPPLESLKDSKGTIVGDISDLLDFAVIGVAKCGTSTMKDFLNQPPLSYVFNQERCNIRKMRERIITDLHRAAGHYSNSSNEAVGHTLIGLKCPNAIGQNMNVYSTSFPHTKFIVGLRHPVHWFQSFYNFRVNNEGLLLDPLLLSGGRIKGCENVFADRARYHFLLARLGKTPLKDERELSLVFSSSDEADKKSFYQHFLNKNVGQKVFLYHVEQLSSDNDGGSKIGANTTAIEATHSALSSSFVKDLSNFLGLNQTLHHVAEKIVPGKKLKPKLQAQRDSLKINICDAVYKPLRNILVNHGRTSSRWIREYFLQSPDVFVPSGTSFDMIMDQWTHDPCELQATDGIKI